MFSLRNPLLLPLILIFCLETLAAEAPSKYAWDFGLTTGDPNPFALQVGLRREAWGVRIASGIWGESTRTWQTGTRVGLGYHWVVSEHYSIETGLFGSYFFAQATDSLALAVNHALKRTVMYDAQWVEWFGVGPQITVRFSGLFVQAGWPVLQFGDLRRNLEWRAGFSI